MDKRSQVSYLSSRARSSTLRWLHLSTALLYFSGLFGTYNLSCMLHYEDSPSLYGGNWKYLTYWTMFAHFAFFAFSCATDVIRHSRPDSTLLRIRDVVFAGIVFPFGLFVPIMFWGIYAINREMIFPEVLDGFYPAWLNHISHTILLPVVLLEAVIVNHRYPSRRGGFACMLAYGVAYTLWIFYLAVAKDIWVYTIFKYMTWYIKIAFFAGCFVLALFLYIVCEKINYYFWDARRKIRLSASSM